MTGELTIIVCDMFVFKLLRTEHLILHVVASFGLANQNAAYFVKGRLSRMESTPGVESKV